MKRYARGSHPYYQYKHQRSLSLAPQKRRRPWLLVFLFPIIGLLFAGSFLYARPLPLISPEAQVLAQAALPQPKISWPAESQAAFGTVEAGLLESEPGQVVRPTASTIKLLTALTILKTKPLKIGEQGPLIPITQTDVDIYNDYYTKDGSVIKVEIDEKISQYQMLQGILLPSSNNYSDSLAIWAFGSLEKYRIAAQAMAKQIGLKQTTIGEDASGFLPSSTSNASDLVLLGIAAMKHPVVADIVKLSEVELPIVGIKQNTNWLLGDEGVIGVKTGNNNEVGGVFIFAYNHLIDPSHKTTIVGVIQGEPTVFDAVLKSRSFIQNIKPHFKTVTPIKKGQVMARYIVPWGEKVPATAKEDISLLTWPGKEMKPNLNLKAITPNLPSGSEVGEVVVNGIASKVVTNGEFAAPTLQWRIFER